MPVKYVQLYCGHAVQVALQRIERDEVASNVDHQSTPGKPRLVLNGNCRSNKAVGGSLYQLQKCLQPAHDSESRRCFELRTRCADLQRVRFIFTEFLYCLSLVFAVNDQRGLSRVGYLHV